ncbi:ABC transporter permease [Modestobacter sp. NPDC049651]|uniref:ABC transporter permease n=1 Tax=unclassified Modestobacter TaxID=2643866 RepID=UPI0033E4F5E9
MTALAWRSLRARGPAFAATALSVLLGTAVLLAFLSLLETGLADGVGAPDRETLVTMALVVGGWGLVIVVFSIASMLGLTVRRRAEEFALLRTLGTSRRQVRRLVAAEVGLVTAASAVAGVLPGWLLGRLVVALLHRGDVVADTVAHRTGWLSVSLALGEVLVAALLAGALAARQATRGSAQEGLTASRVHRARLGRWRIAGGALLLLAGATCSVLALTVRDSADPYAAMSFAGPASVFWSIGLAVFAPVLLRLTAAALAPLLRAVPGGVAGHLAAAHTRRRAHELAGVLSPVLVFVGVATGTLYLMQVHNAAVPVRTPEGDTVELLNYLVVGMLAAFAAIMVVNGTLAAVADRRREFAQQRLAGVTRGELTTTVAAEAAVLVLTALLFGGLAALGTVVPYSVVKTDGWLAGDGPGLFLGVAAVAVLVTVGTAVAATRRVTAGPALRAAR